ncbi:MAG TPA: hypothetical protein VHF58_11170 [Solirubrobacterales bacterium]|nr:hypothetical protein [Solirubrobacterales bacterium]
MSSASKKKRRRRRPRAVSPAQPQPAASTATEKSAPPKPKPRRSDPEGRPPAPWGSFPLVELVVLIGIGMLIAGAIVGTDETRGRTLLGTGLVLASLAGLELSIREHFGGFRSHTVLLASVIGVATMLGSAYLADLDTGAAVLVGAVAGLAAGFLLIRAFRARSGGRSVKLK